MTSNESLGLSGDFKSSDILFLEGGQASFVFSEWAPLLTEIDHEVEVIVKDVAPEQRSLFTSVTSPTPTIPLDVNAAVQVIPSLSSDVFDLNKLKAVFAEMFDYLTSNFISGGFCITNATDHFYCLLELHFVQRCIHIDIVTMLILCENTLSAKFINFVPIACHCISVFFNKKGSN